MRIGIQEISTELQRGNKKDSAEDDVSLALGANYEILCFCHAIYTLFLILLLHQ